MLDPYLPYFWWILAQVSQRVNQLLSSEALLFDYSKFFRQITRFTMGLEAAKLFADPNSPTISI